MQSSDIEFDSLLNKRVKSTATKNIGTITCLRYAPAESREDEFDIEWDNGNVSYGVFFLNNWMENLKLINSKEK